MYGKSEMQKVLKKTHFVLIILDGDGGQASQSWMRSVFSDANDVHSFKTFDWSIGFLLLSHWLIQRTQTWIISLLALATLIFLF